jgi:hypothetical protein
VSIVFDFEDIAARMSRKPMTVAEFRQAPAEVHSSNLPQMEEETLIILTEMVGMPSIFTQCADGETLTIDNFARLMWGNPGQ